MKTIAMALIAGLGLAVAGSAHAADADKGKAVFGLWCSDCHAATGGRYGIPPPGWNVLQKRYQGTAIPGELDKRTDLSPVYIKTIVRNGVNIMPRTRKTEVTDEDLDNLVAYLTRNNK